MIIIENTLVIDEELTDEDIKQFMATIEQDSIEKIEVKTNNLGASIVQALLICKRDKEVVVEDAILQKIFENVVYKSI